MSRDDYPPVVKGTIDDPEDLRQPHANKIVDSIASDGTSVLASSEAPERLFIPPHEIQHGLKVNAISTSCLFPGIDVEYIRRDVVERLIEARRIRPPKGWDDVDTYGPST